MTVEDTLIINAGIAALRHVSALIRASPGLIESAREPLVLRDIEGLAHRLEEPNAREWELGMGFAFLSPQDIGVVNAAAGLLVAASAPDDRQQHSQSLGELEVFLRRFLNCWI